MKFDTKFIRSRLGRRIFMMFVICALLPILSLSIISYYQVAKQLKNQSYERLHKAVKFHALSQYERLLFIEAEMELIASSVKEDLKKNSQLSSIDLNKRAAMHFKTVAFFSNLERYIPVIGTSSKILLSDPAVKKHISEGKTLLMTMDKTDIFMLRLINAESSGAGYIVGEINTGYLWGTNQGNALPPKTQMSILDESNNILYSAFPNQDAFSKKISTLLKHSTSGQFELNIKNDEYLIGYRSLFMKPQFLISGWTFVLSQSKADVLNPMADFKKIFPMVVLMSLWIVLLLSIYYIRKSLVPLELLKEGTRRIANKDFECQVQVNSHDEFEELATDFNNMGDHLKRQFQELDTKAEIDKAILSSLETKEIAKTVITRMGEWFSCDSIGISLMDIEQDNIRHTFLGNRDSVEKISKKLITLNRSDFEKINLNPEYLIFVADENTPLYLENFLKNGMKSILVLPVFLNKKISAIIMIARISSVAYSKEEITQARKMADQVAVGLSNSHLIEELNLLNWGTLMALARTVDAKSKWTAGHSERVTTLSVKIGDVMGLESDQIENLHRGTLLHDIGKLGIPVTILDKPDKLTDEEYQIIKKHPAIGAQILEPIKAYAKVIPLVLQHHERYDGKGYPDGVGGHDLSIGARILAVADVFDALKADRPYRKGNDIEWVINFITKESGRMFDPEVVDAFVKVMLLEKTQSG